MRILIVEADANVAQQVEATLTSLGYEVVGVVADSDEAMRLALLESPDVVVLDTAILESADGVEINTVLSRTMGIPVIHLAARAEIQAADQAAASSYFGYVPKPFDPPTLRAAIEVVSYRHRLEELLRADEGWFKGLLVGMSEAVVATDSRGQVTFVNPAAERLLARPAEGLTGKDVTQVVQLVGRPRPSAQLVREALATGRTLTLPDDTSLRVDGGEGVPVDGTVSAVFGYGRRVTGAVIVLHDATRRRATEDALRQREARYRSLFTGDVWASIVLDVHGRIRDCSESFAELLGVGSREGMQGRSIQEFLPVPLEYEYLASRLKEGGYFPPHERTLRRIDGVILHVIMALRQVADEPITILVRLLDIGEQKRFREERETMRRSDATARFAGGLAHRFNNIFQIIRGSAEILGEDGFSEELAEDLDHIIEASDHGAHLVRAMLAVAQRSLLRDSLLEAGATLREMLPSLGDRAGPGVLLLLQLSENPLWMHVDQHLLGVALGHLVDNAREAMRRGGRLSLTISPFTVPPREEDPEGGLRAGDYVSIALQDSGTGMSERVRERALEPFFTTKPDAAGMGLSAALGIVRQHGGWLALESVPERGTKVIIYIPRARAPEAG